MRPSLVFALALLLLSPAHAAGITAYTEELPPLNFQQGEQLGGYASELLAAMAERADIPVHQQLLPWARAYALVQSTPATLLFSTVRTTEREPLFRWVGPISPRRIYLYRLEQRHDIRLRHAGQLKQLRIGTLFASASQLRLQQLGLPLGAGQDSTHSDAANLAKLKLGRVDLIAMLDWAMHWQLQQAGLPENLVKPAALLDGQGQYWYALNPQTPDDTVKRLQAALDTLVRTGYTQQLRLKYIGRESIPAGLADFSPAKS
jgi:polar amino acid transport system substrate-binding protein